MSIQLNLHRQKYSLPPIGANFRGGGATLERDQEKKVMPDIPPDELEEMVEMPHGGYIYGRHFALFYNVKYGLFAKQIKSLLKNFYESQPISQVNKFVLDLCCGTGRVAKYFMDKGYKVVGIDLSEDMLYYARRTSREHVENGQGMFLCDDVTTFSIDPADTGHKFGFVISTFNSLNHLKDFNALEKCFRRVFPLMEENGFFVFDLNTKARYRKWNGNEPNQGEPFKAQINEGVIEVTVSYDELKNIAKIAIKGNNGSKVFGQTIQNVAFDLEQVRQKLLEIGWKTVYFADIQDLSRPIADPESADRVFVVAQK